MALLNNCLYNAALIGFSSGNAGWLPFTNPVDYVQFKNVAVAFATAVDSKIPFDPLITTGSSNTMLVDTGDNTIQSNTMMRPALLESICRAVMSGRYVQSLDAQSPAFWGDIATRIAALYTELLLGIVSP